MHAICACLSFRDNGAIMVVGPRDMRRGKCDVSCRLGTRCALITSVISCFRNVGVSLGNRALQCAKLRAIRLLSGRGSSRLQRGVVGTVFSGATRRNMNASFFGGVVRRDGASLGLVSYCF